MKNTYLIILLLISNLIFSQNLEIGVGNGKSIVDNNLRLIVCNENITTYNVSNLSSLNINISGNNYHFTNIPSGLQYGQPYQVEFNSQTFTLYFSQTALINISTTSVIVDEPKVLANITVTDITNSPPITSYCGIEYRGGISQSYPKKSYDIELWGDTTGNTTYKVSVLNMRNDDDWLLLSLYNEPLRLRNVINHKLWREMHSIYYNSQEPSAVSGVKTEYAELAINNEYLGIYALTEQVDKKQLKLKKYNGSIRGELYKGVNWNGSRITNLTSYNNNQRVWSGYKMKYPKESESTDWDNLYNFFDFVINSSDSNFENNIANEFEIQNAIDYFIFLNFIRAPDNTGKNTYIAKYKTNEPYYYVPWDLDGTYGILWNGNRANIFDDILTNGLYTRLLNTNSNTFYQQASIRWNGLRNNVLDNSIIISNISQTYNYLLSNGIYDREILKWGANTIDFSNLNYTYNWINNRFDYLNHYFNPTLSSSNNIYSEEKNISIFPNPITSTFTINTKSTTSYSIYNISGVLVKKGVTKDYKIINIEDFNTGIYFLKVPNNKTVLKLIKL